MSSAELKRDRPRGFTHLFCDTCHERHLVAFSCRGRGFCHSCLGRDGPWGRLGYDGKLMGAVCRVFADSVLGWYRRAGWPPPGAKGGPGGAVLALQRARAELGLHVHVHVSRLVTNAGFRGETRTAADRRQKLGK
jgi:hypothetical protein